jgi:predicted AlkP superfamily phosphohydrolase/phosphomutase
VTIDSLCRSEHPWTAFVTGIEPENLGRWSGITFDPATYRHRDAGAAPVEPFWSLGEDATTVSLDVPAATLARGRGAHVVDWAVHEPTYTRSSSPPGLLVDLEERVGRNPVVDLEYAGTWNDGQWLRQYGSALVSSVAQRTAAIEHLLASAPDWQLAVVVFSEPHQIAHHAWHGVAPESVLHEVATAPVARTVLGDVHRALDQAIGRLVAGLGPEDVIVVFSTKGDEPMCDLATNTLAPELLHRLAFGEPFLRQPSTSRWERRGRPPVVLPGGMSHVAYMQAMAGDHRLRRVRLALRRAGFAAADTLAPEVTGRLRVRRRRRRRPPRATPDAVPPAPTPGELPYLPWMISTWYRPWWPRMRAFVLPSFADLHVRINLAGRERDGVVAAEDYELACDEVEQLLRACRNPRTGNQLVADVIRPRGSDPCAEVGLAADVVLSWAEDADSLEHPDAGIVGPYPAWRSGGHSVNAFALVSGGDIGPGHLTDQRLVDLPPTLLALAGLEPRAPLDGTPFPLPRRASAEA